MAVIFIENQLCHASFLTLCTRPIAVISISNHPCQASFLTLCTRPTTYSASKWVTWACESARQDVFILIDFLELFASRGGILFAGLPLRLLPGVLTSTTQVLYAVQGPYTCFSNIFPVLIYPQALWCLLFCDRPNGLPLRSRIVSHNLQHFSRCPGCACVSIYCPWSLTIVRTLNTHYRKPYNSHEFLQIDGPVSIM